MRTCSPYVALPFDPGRLRPELVGLLLHPVSRSETWRRLGTRRTLLRSPRGFHSKHAGPSSWRRAEKLPPQSLGGRVPDCRTGRFAGNRTAKNYLHIVRDLMNFLKVFHATVGV